MPHYTYLALDLLTLLGPLVLSFDRRVHFVGRWRALFLAIVPASGFFLVWDVLFTRAGVWSFNYAYLLGPSAWGLPLEEWLFFLVVPYSTVFIYACCRSYFQVRLSSLTINAITLSLGLLLVCVGLTHLAQAYTATTCFFTAAALGVHWWCFRTRYLESVYLGWLISLLPFLVVNGVLTALPVVLYNDTQNLGVRIYTIPVEDVFYGFLLYLLTVTGMEAAGKLPRKTMAE